MCVLVNSVNSDDNTT
uniref:Uncharacterized protein n=1 Tax=Anguilla anguilla TaxID=7936 RepID=A0A0E9T6M4_ANGAN